MYNKISFRRGRFWTFAPFFIWICVILFLSSSQASAAETSRFLGPLLKFLFPSLTEATLQLYHFYIRKLAHLTEYAILGFFAVRAFAGSRPAFLIKYSGGLALAAVFAVSSIDEINQSFEPSRTGAFGDVLLDLAGGALMILALFIFEHLRSRSSQPPVHDGGSG